jgi:microcystin-dependent protein
MANYEATRYDFDGANLTDIQGLNTGLIIPWTTSSAPTGFLECNGAAVSRSTYAALFAVIGTTYGAGDGSSTFLVPDFQDNCCLSKSGTKALASTGGANTVASTGNVSGNLGNTTIDTNTMGAHSHTYQAGSFNNAGNTGGGSGVNFGQIHAVSNVSLGNAGGGGSHNHNMSANFSGTATSVLQPYLTLMYIIKT